VFLGDVPAHEYAPRVLVTPGSILVLVSATKTSPADVANAFATVVNDHSDPKARAVGLKLMLRELSVEARFSFVLLDLATARVFCASTALSSPLAVGHAPDGESTSTPPPRFVFFHQGEGGNEAFFSQKKSSPKKEALFFSSRTDFSSRSPAPVLDTLPNAGKARRHSPLALAHRSTPQTLSPSSRQQARSW
jgi:hypothetical protein